MTGSARLTCVRSKSEDDGQIMKDKRTVEDRIAEIRRMMQMVSELEAVRKKYRQTLTGGDTANVTMPLEDLEIAVYGRFANMVETRLRYLERDQADWQPPPSTCFDERLMTDGPG